MFGRKCVWGILGVNLWGERLDPHVVVVIYNALVNRQRAFDWLYY